MSTQLHLEQAPHLTGIGPIRSHRTFEAIRHTSFRGRSGPVSVSFLQQDAWSRAEAAYAVSRRVGNAVVRNRLRRRLRAIMSELAPSLPIGAYVVRTGPDAPKLSFDELKVTMRKALEKATRRPVHDDALGAIGIAETLR